MSEVRIKVVPTMAGTAWDETKAYRLLDYIVTDGTAMYMSRKVDAATGVNQGHALTETAWWDKCLDVDALAATAKRIASECAAQTSRAQTATKEAQAQALAAQNAATDATAAAENAMTQAQGAVTATASARAATAAAEKVNATLDVDNDRVLLTVSDRTGAQKAVELTTAAQATQTRQDVETLRTDVAALRKDVDAGKAYFVGMTRVNGSADPSADETYGTPELLHKIGAHMRLALVKDGKVTRYLAPGRLTADVNGAEVAIDGSMGDVMCVTDVPLHLLRATETVDGVERNMMGVGLEPCSWYGHEAKRLPKFGMVPGYAVKAKIYDDAREQWHSVYNPQVAGTYGKADGLVKETYRKNGGGGLFTHTVLGLENLRLAQAKNEDGLTARPYMGLHPDMYGLWLAMMFTECGTLAANKVNLLGVGITTTSPTSDATFSNAAMTANSGAHFILADGTTMNVALSTPMTTAAGAKTYVTAALFGDTLYSCTEMLEMQRVMDGVTKHGWTDKAGDSDTFFYWGDDGELVLMTRQDGLNPLTGEGMEAARTYYQVRGCPGCEDITDGVMTGVVNAYVRLTCEDGAIVNGKDLTGAVMVAKLSRSVYRGMSLPMDGCFKHISYLYNVLYGDGTKNTRQEQWTTLNIEDVQALTSFERPTAEGAATDDLAVLRGLTLARTATSIQNYYAREGDYNTSLLTGDVKGGNLWTYECLYNYDGYAYGVTGDNGVNGIVKEGRKAVCALAAGCYALSSIASARTLCGIYALGSGVDIFAGAFAVLLGQ